MTGPGPSRTVRTFRPGDEPAIRRVLERSLATQPVPGYTRGDMERAIARLPADPDGTVVALENGEVVGYCTPRNHDLTVDPDRRRRGHGRRLVEAALGIAGRGGLADLTLYGPPVEASRAFLAALGFHYHSSLWLLALGPEATAPPPDFPAGIRVRGLREDEDLEAYVGLMNAAFADHPSPMAWTVADIAHVHGLPDFQPDGIRLATPDEEPDRLVGFVVAAAHEPEDGDSRPIGWIGLIGVLPAWRGHGLGRELLHWGIAHLRQRGAGRIELAVEALNERATGLYRRAGFVPIVEYPHFVRAVDDPLPAT